MRRAYSYIRFSSPEQLRGDSLRRQAALSEGYCRRHGLVLDDTLTLRDLGVSAFRSRNAKQGALAAFLQAVKAGKVEPGSVLVIESLDRLSRDRIRAAVRLFSDILDTGVSIVTLTPEREYTPENTTDLAGLLEPLVHMSRAYEESRMKSERARAVWDGKRQRAARQKMTGNCPGWLRPNADRTGFEAVPEGAGVVRRIFHMAADGHGIGSIAKTLNAGGVPGIGRQKRLWHPSFVAKVLGNREVLGEFQPHEWRDGKRVPAGDPIRGYYPAVVTEREWYAAQQAKADRKIERGPKGKGVANLFTGLLRDARDGQTMTVVDKGKRSPGPVLVSTGAQRGQAGSKYLSFPYGVVEEAFLRAVRELRPADLLPPRGAGHDDGPSAELARVNRRIAGIQAELKQDGELTALVPVLRELQAQQKTLSARVEKAKAERARPKPEALGEVKSLADMLEGAKGDRRTELRTRIKARIKSLVSEMWLVVYEKKRKDRWNHWRTDRHAEAQVFFKNGSFRPLSMVKSGGRVACVTSQTNAGTGALPHGPPPTLDLRNYRDPDFGGWYDKPTLDETVPGRASKC
jgi:DNA invertase Pin-like site-specific DNA recombinase